MFGMSCFLLAASGSVDGILGIQHAILSFLGGTDERIYSLE
jgi:hypothetical protein